jgi:transcriptional regulator with XRE-family HTH domain
MPRKLFLKEWRKAKGLTQERLAARLETTAATISRIETGEINYTRESLESLAAALDIEPADLLRDPGAADYQLWRIITGLKPEAQARALRVIRALADEEAA